MLLVELLEFTNNFLGSKFVGGEELALKLHQETSQNKKAEHPAQANASTQLKRKIDTAADNSSDEDTNELEDNIKQIEKKRQRKESEKIAASLKPEKARNELQSADISQNMGEKEKNNVDIDIKSADNEEKKAVKYNLTADSTKKSVAASKNDFKSTTKKGNQVSTAAKIDNATAAKADDKNKPTSEGAELSVESMLKDFSDKLSENLLPDPFDSD